MMDKFSTDQLSDLDVFFFYGSGDINLETQSDIMQNLLQSSRSLFYDRSLDSAGIKDFENFPNALTLQILLPYTIVSSISKRNSFTSAQNPDRRVALSQSTIKITNDSQGLGINVLYVPFSNLQNPNVINLPLGVNK
jgi:hypothetical protein